MAWLDTKNLEKDTDIPENYTLRQEEMSRA